MALTFGMLMQEPTAFYISSVLEHAAAVSILDLPELSQSSIVSKRHGMHQTH